MASDTDDLKPRGYTYAELGEILGISPEAARLRAIRHKWKRISSNDGTPARVDITLDDIRPSDKAARKPKREKGSPRTGANTDPVQAQTIEILNTHLNTLREQLEKAQENLKTTQDERAIERQRVADLTQEVLRLNKELVEASKGGGFFGRLFKGK